LAVFARRRRGANQDAHSSYEGPLRGA